MNDYMAILKNIQSNNIGELEKMIRGVDINKINNNSGDTPLIYAVYNGKKEAVKLLLEYGADPNISMEGGFTPLIVSIGISEDTYITKLLLDYGADSNFEAQYNGTPLMKASQRGNLEAVKLLLDYGADINLSARRTRAGAISMAIGYHHIHIVKLLLDRGVDISLSDNEGHTAYDQALLEIESCANIGVPCDESQNILKLLDDHINTIKSQQKLSFAKTQDKIHSIVGRDMDDGIFRKISEHLSNMEHVPSVHNPYTK